MKKGSSAPKYPIESVDNVLRLLLLLRRQSAIGVSEASEYLGVAPSTAHRLLAMLQHHDFVQQDPVQRSYKAGPALIEVGLAALKDMDVRAQARPHIERLVEEVGETAHLVVLQGSTALFLDCVEGSRALRAGSRTGQVVPAHCTAAGKALLAQLDPERLDDLYPREKLTGLTPRSITLKSTLKKQLAAIAREGYATNQGESEADLRAVAAAVPDRTGRHRAAITVAAPEARLGAKEVPRVAEAVKAAAKAVAEDLV